MSNTIPPSETESISTRKSKRATSASSLTVLNFVLLLLSGTFLFLVATDHESKDAFTKERWELALDKLEGLTERLQGKEPPRDANITNNPEPVPHTSGGEGTVPALLGVFLEESRKPEFRANLKAGQLEEVRAGLVSLINELPGSRRDSLRVEIRDANWLLEAHDILSAPSPDTFEDQLGQYVSLTLLINGVENSR